MTLIMDPRMMIVLCLFLLASVCAEEILTLVHSSSVQTSTNNPTSSGPDPVLFSENENSYADILETDLSTTTVENFVALNQSHLRERQFPIFRWDGPEPLLGDFADAPGTNHRRNQVVLGWAEMFTLAQAATFCVCRRVACPSYSRYFAEEDADFVLRIFNYLLGPNSRGPLEVANPLWPLSLVYGDRPVGGFSDDDCANNPLSAAQFVNKRPDGQGAMIIICPMLLRRYPRRLFEFDCDHLPAYLTEQMQTIGSFLLHEMTHWVLLVAKATATTLATILDYGMSDTGQLYQTDGYPINGYGPYNAMLLNRNRDPRFNHFKTPLRNADSYQMFALEAYYSFQCPNRVFVDPVIPAQPAMPKDIVINVDPGPGPAPAPAPVQPPPADVTNLVPGAEDLM